MQLVFCFFFGGQWEINSKTELGNTPLRYVKKCRNLDQALGFLKDFCYKSNQLGRNNSHIIAFLESTFLNNKFLNTPKGFTHLER